jgi:hypothetical protein
MTENIREFILEVMSDYKNEKSMKYSQSPLAWKIQSGFPQRLRETVFSGGLSYSVRGWAGWGNWIDNPYIMIKHRAVNGKAKNSLSIMYVFSADMQYCYLALMVRWERPNIEEIAKEARICRNKIRPRNSAQYSEYMDLRSIGEMAHRMEEACVFCRVYRGDIMPEETVLKEDLISVITLYESYLRMKKFGRTPIKGKDDAINRVYIKYRLGREDVHCHCEAVYADSDNYTAEMVENICKRSGCSGIISTSPSQKYDLNRHANPRNMDAICEYRDTMQRILRHMEVLGADDKVIAPYLHIAFHAIRNGDTHGSEIRVSYTEPASYSMINWFSNKLKDKTRNISVHGGSPVRVNVQYVDRQSNQFQRYWESCQIYNGENKAYHFILVEISEDLRSMSHEALVKAFTETVRDFSSEFGEIRPGAWYERQIG